MSDLAVRRKRRGRSGGEVGGRIVVSVGPSVGVSVRGGNVSMDENTSIALLTALDELLSGRVKTVEEAVLRAREALGGEYFEEYKVRGILSSMKRCWIYNVGEDTHIVLET